VPWPCPSAKSTGLYARRDVVGTPRGRGFDSRRLHWAKWAHTTKNGRVEPKAHSAVFSCELRFLEVVHSFSQLYGVVAGPAGRQGRARRPAEPGATHCSRSGGEKPRMSRVVVSMPPWIPARGMLVGSKRFRGNGTRTKPESRWPATRTPGTVPRQSEESCRAQHHRPPLRRLGLRHPLPCEPLSPTGERLLRWSRPGHKLAAALLPECRKGRAVDVRGLGKAEANLKSMEHCRSPYHPHRCLVREPAPVKYAIGRRVGAAGEDLGDLHRTVLRHHSAREPHDPVHLLA